MKVVDIIEGNPIPFCNPEKEEIYMVNIIQQWDYDYRNAIKELNLTDEEIFLEQLNRS